MPLQFESLYDRHEIFVWSNCLLDLGTDFLMGDMVFIRDAEDLSVAPHFHGLYSSLELCRERAHDSQAFRKMDVTHERISRIQISRK